MQNGITITINAETAKAYQDITRFFQSMEVGLQRVSAFAARGLGLAGITASIAGVEAATHSVLRLGSELQNLHTRTGGAIQDLVLLQRQLQESGGSAESAGLLLSFMQRNIVRAAEEGGAAAKIFTDLKLSISLSQLTALSATEQYRLLGSAIASIENPAKRAETVLAIFGRGEGNLASAFSNAGKFRAAFAGPNPFGEVMARSSEAFHVIEVSLERLAGNAKRITAGILDQVVPAFESIATRLGQIDFTSFGQRIGGLAMVIVQAWKDDRLPEMIGLLIEAGFELGLKAAQNLWQGFLKSISFLTSAQGGSIWAALFNGILTFGVRAAEFLLKALTTPVSYMAAAFEVVYSKLREQFQLLGNWLREHVFAPLLNWFIDAFNALAARFYMPEINRVKAKGEEVEPATTYDAALARERKVAEDSVAGIVGYLDKQLEASRQLLGINTKITDQDNLRATALDRLNNLIEQQMQKRAKEATVEPGRGGPPIDSRLGTLREIERLQKEKLLVLDQRLADVETSYALTAVVKYDQKRKILQEQRVALEAIVSALKERATIEDATTAEATLGRADTFSKQIVEKNKQVGALGPDPNSLTQQFKAAMVEIQNQWGTWVQQLAVTFRDVIGTAISSVSQGITGLIRGTETWSQALLNIGNSVLNVVIEGLVKMFAAWITGRNAASAVELATQAAELPGKVISAVATAITSYGAAAVIGLAAALAALGAGLAWASGAFAEGGRPQVGKVAIVGERGPELFVPDSAGTIIPNHVARGFLSESASRGIRSQDAGPTIRNDNRFNIGVFHDRAMFRDWARSEEGRNVIVDVWRQSAHEVSRI